MFTNHKALLVACVAALLAACGGGGDSGSSSTPAPTPAAATYGAIYINQGLGVGYSFGQPSQAVANAGAKSHCVISPASPNSATAATCDLKLEFGQNLCGSVFRSVNNATTGAWGVASDGSAVTAEAKALSECVRVGGTNCTFGWSGCNGTGTPSSRSQTAMTTVDPLPGDGNIESIVQPENLK